MNKIIRTRCSLAVYNYDRTTREVWVGIVREVVCNS